MTHRAIIWDMNGVLVDDESHQWDAFRWVLNGLGVYPADATLPPVEVEVRASHGPGRVVASQSVPVTV